MKILMVDQIAKVNYKYSYSLAEAVKYEGNEVVLAVDQKEEPELCTCRIWNLFNTDEKNIGKIDKLKNYIASYKSILEEIKNGNYDVIHTQWLIFSPVDYYYLNKIKKLGVKLVVTIHDILPFNQKFYDFRYHKKVYSLADRIIVQADNNVQRFNELFPELAGKEVMIPHGHFLDYAEPVDKSEARKKLNIPEDKFVFLFFGQIKKVKGVGVLLEAFTRLYRDHPNALLIIAGSVWKDDFSQYQEIVDREKNMKNQVRTDIRYIPDVDVKYYYSAADCCVLPYLDVYQSGVIQLCYAYKKPVVATRIGAFKEVVVENKTGFMCKADDPEGLADAMKMAISKTSELDEMGERGYEYIAEKFSWKRIARLVNKLYAD